MNWISVKDRLPQDRQSVLCYGKNELFEEGDIQIFSGKFIIDDKHPNFHRRQLFHGWHVPGGKKWLKTFEITHWMPLPEKP